MATQEKDIPVPHEEGLDRQLRGGHLAELLQTAASRQRTRRYGAKKEKQEYEIIF